MGDCHKMYIRNRTASYSLQLPFYSSFFLVPRFSFKFLFLFFDACFFFPRLPPFEIYYLFLAIAFSSLVFSRLLLFRDDVYTIYFLRILAPNVHSSDSYEERIQQNIT